MGNKLQSGLFLLATRPETNESFSAATEEVTERNLCAHVHKSSQTPLPALMQYATANYNAGRAFT